MSNIFIGLKKDLFGCFRIREERDNHNETGLKKGVIEIENLQVLPYTRCSIYAMLALFSLFVLYTYLSNTSNACASYIALTSC